MKILAIETSGDHCSVALWRDGTVEERGMPASQRQSGLVLELVHALLGECGETLRHVDGIAYGAGPGSFTGLRIACGVTQGLALGIDKPVVGIGTLLALAAGSAAPRVVCCVDARMREVYQAAYERQGGEWCEVQAPGVYAPQAVPLLPGTGWQACGNGFAAYGDVLRVRYANNLSAIDAAVYPRAREVAVLAAPVFARGGGVAPELAAPLYVRNKVALTMQEQQGPHG